MTIEADGYKFDFTTALNVFVFDEKDTASPYYHGLSHAMKAVDLIVELAEAYIYIELKKFKNPDGYQGSRLNKLIQSLKYKFRDSFLYRYAENKVDKPIHYICLLNLDPPILNTINDRLRKELPTGKPISRWSKEVTTSCHIVDLATWNRNFPKWPAAVI